MTQRPHRLLPVVLLLSVAAILLSGCVEQQTVRRNPWDQMFMDSDLYDVSSSETAISVQRNPTSQSMLSTYAVELGRYTGGDALDAYRVAREDCGLANVWYAGAGVEMSVYAGRFTRPDSAEAMAVLDRVRNAEFNGTTPFADAQIVSVNANAAQTLDPYDLRSLRGRGLYSLQIGFYDSSYGIDFRRAAEQAVKEMREDGIEAYYHHGPRRSMILLNAYTYNEAFTRQGTVDRYSNTIRTLQESYPHNVPNGESFSRSAVEAGEVLPSFLIQVP